MSDFDHAKRENAGAENSPEPLEQATDLGDPASPVRHDAEPQRAVTGTEHLTVNVLRAIEELRIRKEQVENAIASLEDLSKDGHSAATLQGRRGRKSMGPEERRKVSERLRKYWAGRRQSQAN